MVQVARQFSFLAALLAVNVVVASPAKLQGQDQGKGRDEGFGGQGFPSGSLSDVQRLPEDESSGSLPSPSGLLAGGISTGNQGFGASGFPTDGSFPTNLLTDGSFPSGLPNDGAFPFGFPTDVPIDLPTDVPADDGVVTDSAVSSDIPASFTKREDGSDSLPTDILSDFPSDLPPDALQWKPADRLACFVRSPCWRKGWSRRI